MTIENILQILTLLVSGGIVGQIAFFNSRKRKEAAAATKEEDDNVRAYADEWKELYEHEHAEHLEDRKVLNGKIDSLFGELSEQRAQMRRLKDEKNDLLLRTHELEWNRCEVNGCSRRRPPRKRELGVDDAESEKKKGKEDNKNEAE